VRVRARPLGVALLALIAPQRAPAQTASDLFSLGVRAYQNLDYEAATSELRGALARSAGGDTLTVHDRLDALMYLAATELFLGHHDSASATVRRLVWLEPTYRPNELIFPPSVTTLFGDARRATKAVAVRIAPVTELRVGTGRFRAHFRASEPHALTVAITRPDGTPLRVLYAGAIAESLEVEWDGRTSGGALWDDGEYVLRATSAAGADRGLHAVLVPLTIARVLADTGPGPRDTVPAAALPPAPARALLHPLAAGLLAAAAVVALPAVVGRSPDATPARFAVAGAIGLSGFLGFRQSQAPPRPPAAGPPSRIGTPPRPVARQAATLLIRAGPPTVFAPEAP
jgi:hypothetical protein